MTDFEGSRRENGGLEGGTEPVGRRFGRRHENAQTAVVAQQNQRRPLLRMVHSGADQVPDGHHVRHLHTHTHNPIITFQFFFFNQFKKLHHFIA